MIRPIGATIWIGKARNPNKVTGDDILLRWEAALVPLRECEGGGWYTESRTERGWSFRWKLVHRGWYGSCLDGSTWNTKPLEELLEDAIREAHRVHCKREEDGPQRHPTPGAG